MDQAYAGFPRATTRADASVGYCLATGVHIADSALQSTAQPQRRYAPTHLVAVGGSNYSIVVGGCGSGCGGS